MKNLNFKIKINTLKRNLVSVDNFSILNNGITFLFGESGIGKSLISKSIYGILDSNELDISINNQAYINHKRSAWTNEIRKNGFFVFQEPSSHLNPLETIKTQLSEGSLKNCSTEKKILDNLWYGTNENNTQKILELYPKPYRPSGGEKQRILLAMAFKKIDIFINSQSQENALFIFDEPTGSLDNNYRNLFLNMLLEKFRYKNFSILIITHDYSIITELYKKHEDLLHKISLNELLKKQFDNNVICDQFNPNKYLSWLNNVKLTSNKVTPQNTPVLQFFSKFSIFNRNLTIYKNNVESNLVINRGEMVYLKAPSGIGKTTLAKIIMGLYSAQKMSMRLINTDIDNSTEPIFWQKNIWGKIAGMVFQHADESLDLQTNVKGLFNGLPLQKKLTDQFIYDTLCLLFPQNSVDNLLTKKIAHLSGGQKQRLNLLRTLSLNTPLIILDEPLNGLDFETGTKVLELFEQKRRNGTSFLLISHNEEIFDSIVDKNSIYHLREDSISR